MALLVGVAEYSAPDFAPIPTIPKDLQRLDEMLAKIGYAVEVLPVEQLTRGQIRGRLIEFLMAPKAAEATVLLYLSGHGLHVNGEDYLVPQDALSLQYAEKDPRDALVNTDLRAAVTDSKADAVLLFVDACREGLGTDGRKAALRPDFGAHLEARKHPKLLTVNGCEPKGYCYYNDKLGASIFAEGLIRAIGGSDARTVREVLATTDREVQGLMEQYMPGRSQHLNISVSLDSPDDGILDRELVGAPPGRWPTVVRESPLWARVDGAVDEAVIKAVEQVAATAWERVQLAVAALPEDPWRDPGYPERCLKWLDAVLLAPATRFSIAEVAALLAAPFVREAVLAEGVARLAKADPLELRPAPDADDVRAELEATHQLFPRVTERGQRLSERERAALGSWLLHRAVLRRVELWSAEGSSPAHELLRPLAATIAAPADAEMLAKAMHALAVYVAAFRDDVVHEKDTDKPRLRETVTVYSPAGEEVVLRQEAGAVLLALAGQLAVDLRQLRDVIPEHIGIRERLWPEDVLAVAADRLIWSAVGSPSTLRAIVACPHPAIHLALLDQIERTRELLDLARRRCEVLNAELCAPLRGLPDRVGSERIRPDPGAYDLPLLTFRLADDEIRDLLMGVRLYGSPSLAYRELYQNALDACRYRQVRSQYADRAYEGRISFREGVENGRRYVECEDNGVGMGDYELEQLFSRGGRRFVNSPEFLWERAKWRRKGLGMWPNSRFGIGVFSYFMLAEEIEIETARVDRDTVTANLVLDVRISSSGSLFRISRRADPGHGGGTRVRLWLRDPEQPVAPDPNEFMYERRPSCGEALRGFLRFAEFEVVYDDQEGIDHARWPAGELTAPEPVVRTGRDVWFVKGQGGLLADGIVTDQNRFGFYVNLWRDLQPVLSVDRQRLESWDAVAVERMLSDAAAGLHPAAKALDYGWLWEIAHQDPRTGQHVVEALTGTGEVLDVTLDEPGYGPPLAAPVKAGTAPVSLLGAFAYDRAVANASAPTKEAATPWGYASSIAANLELLWWARRRRLEELGIVAPVSSRDIPPPPDDVSWQPILEPIDHVLISPSDSWESRYRPANRGYTDARSVAARIAVASRMFGRSVREIARSARRLVVFDTIVSPPLRPEPSEAIAEESDIPLLEMAADLAQQRDEVLDVLDLGGLIDAASHRQTTVRALAARLDELGFESPALPDHPLMDQVPERPLAMVLSMLTGARPFSFLDVAQVLRYLPYGEMEASVKQVVGALTGLDEEELDAAERCAGDHDNLRALSRDGDGARPWLTGRVTREQLQANAARIDEPPERTLDRLREFAPLVEIDLEHLDEQVQEPAPEDDHLYEALPELDQLVVSKDFEGTAPWIRGELPWENVLALAVLQERPMREVVQRLTKLSEQIPITVPEFPAEYLDWTPNAKDLAVVPDAPETGGSREFDVAPLHFVQSALETRETIGATARRFWKMMPMFSADVHAPPEKSLAPLDSVLPEWRDTLLLKVGGRSDGDAIDGAVGPMHVMRVALRLGCTLGPVWDRLSTLSPLGLQPPGDGKGPWRDRIPQWQDFIVLTVHLDGAGELPPGPIPDGHVARAALAADESEHETQERLRAYASLFGLEPD